jgi:hypothetical protein
VKSKRWARNVARREKRQYIDTEFLCGNVEKSGHLDYQQGYSGSGCTMEMDPEDGRRMEPAQDRVQWRDLVSQRLHTVMKLVHFINLNEQFSPEKDIQAACISLRNIEIRF